MGSKRIPGKNIKTLGGHPLIAYAIQSALDSGLFGGVFVSSDSDKTLDIADYYGAKRIKRPPEYATDKSPDAEWINHALGIIRLYTCLKFDDGYAIVRPTNPFRTGDMIKRAFSEWDKESNLKSIYLIQQHPFKAWEAVSDRMYNWFGEDEHLNPTNTFPKLYYQNGAIEFRCISMDIEFQPFFTEGYEGFDLNTPEDWILAEALIEKGYAKLPRIEKEPYDFTAV